MAREKQISRTLRGSRAVRHVAATVQLVFALAFAGPAAGQSPSPAAAATTPAAGPTAAAVTVRVSPHAGYGRIVFDWPDTPVHTARLNNRALTIDFARPFTAQLDDIVARLGQYAAAARIDGDGRSALITLKAGIRYKSFVTGKSVVVDLLPAPTDTAHADQPETKAPAVPVRIGTHATFSRFVFEWPRAVDYTVAGGEIRFSRKGRFDLAALRRSLPPLVRAVAANDGAQGTTIALTLSDGAQLRHFRTGMSVVVDVIRAETPAVLAKKSGQTRASAQGSAKPAAKTGAGSARKGSAVSEFAADKPQAPAATLSTAPQGPVALFDMQGKPVNARAERLLRAEDETAPVPLLPAKSAVVRPAPASAVPVILTLEPAAAVMKFHWPEEVGAAVFERAGHLWAVFDREARLAFEGWDEALAKPSPNSKRIPEEKPAAAFIARPKFSAMPGTTIFRMKIPPGVNPRVVRDKAAWVVTLEREYLRPASGIRVESHLAATAGARLFIAFPDAGQAVAASDPEVGDRIWVVPLQTPEKGIGLERRLAEVELFATAQGIAGRALSDDIDFRTLPKGIEIASRHGLILSGVHATANGTTKSAGAGSASSAGRTRPGLLFDFENWRRESAGSFVENKHALLRDAAMAQPTTRNAKRLELAQLYFSYDYLTDVLGLIQVIEQDEPQLAQEPVFRAMRGAAYYRLGDRERAARDLNHNSLDGFKEISLWRAGVAAKAGDWGTASRYFSRSENVLRDYPVPLRLHFGLLAAEASLNIGDLGLAKFHLDTLESLSPSPSGKAQIDYLRGRSLYVDDPDGAIAAWDKAIAGPDRQIRVRAALARTELLLEKEKITKAEVVDTIERLRYSWRGDDLEFKVLMRLGRAHLEANDYKNGLLTLRELATHFPKHPEAGKVIDEMRAAFVKLYVDGEADKVPPLTALALYDEFRELTPEGDVGNKLIARLAERLVAVDLLDRAATLLKHLVDQRLKGRDRFDAANQLALVFLLDRKPQDALDALAGEVPANIIPQWATTRRHLKARALVELARYKDGLVLIAGDSSLDAEMLRAEVFWKMRDWTNAALAYDRIVKATVKDSGKRTGTGAGAASAAVSTEIALNEDAQRNILSLAIAYALGRNQPALTNVRTKFLARMAKGPYKDSFDVVTAPSGNVPDDYRVISSKVAEVDQFRNFLRSYRDQLLARGKASAARPGPSAAMTAPAASG